MKIDFESKPVYVDDDKYIKTKIKIYENGIAANFHNKKILIMILKKLFIMIHILVVNKINTNSNDN